KPDGSTGFVQMDGQLASQAIVRFASLATARGPCNFDDPVAQLACLSLVNRYRADLIEVADKIALGALYDPLATYVADGRLPPLLKIDPNGGANGVATYADRPPAAGDDDREGAVARAFHRAHAKEWCSQVNLQSLRDRVVATRAAAEASPSSEATALTQTAETVCVALARRHVHHLSGPPENQRKSRCETLGAGGQEIETTATPVDNPWPALMYESETRKAAGLWCRSTCGNGKIDPGEECDATASGPGEDVFS